jgi:hypothetical protein
MELKEWLEKYKNWFIYPIGILCFYYFFSTIDSNKKNKSTQVENVSEETQVQTPVWSLIDEKDKFGDNTGKKIIQYETKGMDNISGTDYKVDIKIMITKFKIGILESFEGKESYFSYVGGRWDLRNSLNEEITIGKIDSWKNGLGFGIIKYSFEGKDGQYRKLLNFLTKSNGEIRNVITSGGISTFKINTEGLESLLEQSKDVLSDGLTKEEKF